MRSMFTIADRWMACTNTLGSSLASMFFYAFAQQVRLKFFVCTLT